MFRDQVIPCWAESTTALLTVAARLPMLPYVAWDVALTDLGLCVIEGNHWTEVAGFQLNRPWLDDPRIRRFFEHHGIV